MPAAGPVTFLHLSPHPDDESVAVPATLLALRMAGHRVLNLACGLGQPGEEERRRTEVEEACRRADFELLVHDPPLPVDDGGGHADVRARLAVTVERLVAAEAVDVLVAPSPHDGHPGHEVVGRAACEAAARGGRAPRLWLWGLWADLPWPTLYSGFDEAAMEGVVAVLEAHGGELARNDYRVLVRGRAAANRSLGSERVFGFGTAIRPQPYAELLTEVVAREGGWWTGGARELLSGDPLAEPLREDMGRARPIGWWLQAPTFRELQAHPPAA